MAIEESKIRDLIASYEERENLCRDSGGSVSMARANLYEMVIKDLEALLPRKTLANLGVTHYTNLTGTMVEYKGMRGVLLGGSCDVVTLFTLADTCVVYADPSVVCLLDEDRVWDEWGNVL